ncbi:MAG: heavy metal translocating P-type ATPase [Oribacterium sp.]|jgi:Cd2+/Zn2+-exporting ATPase|nr:heavy metal translocating P-type ATPase [Oribacterium sp.]MDY6315771.1 heavy metal translocating P-type ATPase [Oribacterium sp.]
MEPKLRKELNRIIASIIVFFAMMIIDKTGMLPVVFENRLVSFIVYLVPYFMCGYDVVRKALLGIKNRQPFDESFLMFVATIGAFVTGENSEAVAVMAFYQVGEWFQKYALGKSRKSIKDLMDIVPETANVEREDGTVEEVDPDDVEVGDTLIVKPGEKVPVDGVVLSGDSMVNTAALTGESVPRSVHAGDQIISGCINGEGLLRVRAEKAFEDSTVSKILELVENASEVKSKTENFITRFARYYTPIVVYAALALAIIPSIITRDPQTWVYRACTFLVISCPCALVISVPLAFFGGIGAASRNGVLVKGSNYLELMASLDTVVSDKTGTMTEGNFVVSAVNPVDGVSSQELLHAAAIAEGMSTHPIAVSIRNELKIEFPDEKIGETAVDTDNVSGQGIIARADGHTILAGNSKLMEAQGITYQDSLKQTADEASMGVAENEMPDTDTHQISARTVADDGLVQREWMQSENQAATVVYIAVDGHFYGSIFIRDMVKKDAAQAIREMKQEGVREIVMLTGDRKQVGEAVAKELGIDTVYSELLPQDKVSKVDGLIKQLETGGNRKKFLAFVGDGINDAPVLRRADVGIAMGSMGSDAAIEAADIVIMDDDLLRIPMVIRIARKTVGISTQNIVFALFVKALILILGAIGLANMWAAVFADVGVAVLCILNSMRLIAIKRTI